ncbi:heme oxygenase-like, multi-helical [Metarhizium album ARSEF 1941]|uniref:Heme oxygenase-like, multi-helical n=1 Tax=Metarhizium album (strain ARSEF 1941) TaxID=1081103 RepID=A0A0B2X4G7_METAS|nr:heme oxygenase-like, multi-helical [Metarhizium album ARSEF 1941]KHO00315.1 heme oxygenase-like, multi-helical [Metarhizium album ARSEF 1941]
MASSNLRHDGEEALAGSANETNSDPWLHSGHSFEAVEMTASADSSAAQSPLQSKQSTFWAGMGLGGVARRTLGVCLLLLTVFLWTLTNFLASFIFSDHTYDKPFFLVYINTSIFAISLIPMFAKYLVRKGVRGMRHDLVQMWNEYGQQSSYTAIAPEDDSLDNETLMAGNETAVGAIARPDETLSLRETAILSLEFCMLWFFANYFASACLEYTSVASVTILESTSSVWTLVFCALFRVDPFSVRKLVGVFASLVGVVLISTVDLSGKSDEDRGSFPHKTPGQVAIGDSMALLSAVIYGMYITVMKRRVGNEDRVDMRLFFGLVGLCNLALLWPLFFILHWTGIEPFQMPPSGKIWIIIIANSLASFVSDISWAFAMLLTTPLVVTVSQAAVCHDDSFGSRRCNLHRQSHKRPSTWWCGGSSTASHPPIHSGSSPTTPTATITKSCMRSTAGRADWTSKGQSYSDAMPYFDRTKPLDRVALRIQTGRKCEWRSSTSGITDGTRIPRSAEPQVRKSGQHQLNEEEDEDGMMMAFADISHMAFSDFRLDPSYSFRRDRPLAESIAIATRSLHARLNKLIIERLPLVLPPQAADSLTYASGLLHIAPIYATFESLWSDIVHGSFENSRDEREGSKPNKTIVSNGTREMLGVLYIPGLLRAERLVADIQSMTGWKEAATREQLEMIGKTGHLAEVVKHIKRAIKNKPHVLLAYSYILYMALFAGGRFIRATLESAGQEFWDTTAASCAMLTSQSRSSNEDLVDGMCNGQTGTPPRGSHGRQPLRFFHFDTAEDGEDLKRDYKRKLADCDASLSYQEKHDIVQEAICIFENMVLLVAQLDTVVATGPIRLPADSPTSVESATATVKQSLIHPRFRDSVVVAKERSARGARGSLNKESGMPSGRSDSEEDPKPGENKTPAAHMRDDALPSEPDNHPTMPATTDVELCSTVSKSVRFEKTLPHPSRSDLGGVADSAEDLTVGLTESLKMDSKRLRREHVTNCVLGVAIGTIFVGALLSGRRAASLETI